VKCPSCGYLESKVVDSRPTDEGKSIRRRRECLECGARFTTFETLESYPILVIKKNGTREAFDRNKIMNGLVKACQKRPVAMDQLEKVVSDIESELQNSLNHEIQSQKIGEMIMDKLKKIDEVAYVRFTSVYREFKDLDTFMRELAALKSETRK
jgi:transcriptional repressor NrdR